MECVRLRATLHGLGTTMYGVAGGRSDMTHAIYYTVIAVVAQLIAGPLVAGGATIVAGVCWLRLVRREWAPAP